MVVLLVCALLQDDPVALVERLRSEDAAERRTVEGALLKLGTPAATAAAAALTAPPADPAARVAELVKALAVAAWSERDRAMRELGKLGPAARAPILRHAEAADPEVAWRARAALGELGERAPREESLAALRDAALCRILGELGGVEAAPSLLRVLAEPAVEVRADVRLRAAEAMGKLRPSLTPAQAEEAVEHALALLERARDPRDRGVLLRAIGRLRSASAARPLAALAEDRSEKNLLVRRAAIAALGGAVDARSQRAVVEALGSEEAYLREAAAAALERAAGESFGFDPAAPPGANEGPIAKARAWWSKAHGKPWAE